MMTIIRLTHRTRLLGGPAVRRGAGLAHHAHLR